MSTPQPRRSDGAPQISRAAGSILSIDLNERAQHIRRRILEPAGFRVLEAADGATALRLAETEAPSLVLLDIRRPNINVADEICERLKSNPRTASIPVIPISAPGSMADDLPESLRRHTDAYLREPLAPETLVAAVKALIRSRVSGRDRFARAENCVAVVQSAIEGIWILDADGRILFVNRRLADTLHFAPDEMVGRYAWDFARGDERNGLQAAFRRRFACDAPDRFDVPLQRRDGGIVWLSGAGKNSPNRTGAAAQRTVMFIDITDRKQAEEGLLDQERLKLALEMAELAAWEVDAGTRSFSASPQGCAMFGVASGRPLEEWLARIHPEDRSRVDQAMNEAMSGASCDIRFRVLKADGGSRWIHARARRVCDNEERMTRLVGLARDITELVEAAAAGEQQGEPLQAIIENVPVMLCVYDPPLRAFHVNREFERVLGWTPEDANSGDFLAMLYPDVDYRCEVTSYMRSLAPGWRELLTTARSGETIPCEWANIQLSDDRILGIGIDLRERKRAESFLERSEAALRARAAELQAIMDALPVAAFVSRDPECRDVIGSRLSYDLLRLKPGSNLSLSALANRRDRSFRFLHEGREILPLEWPAQRAVDTGAEVRDYEFDIVFDDGAQRNMLGHSVPLFGEDGRPSGAVAAFLDITDRKQAEQRLRQSQKLESLGLLAGGIAHDFNNLLTAIMGNASIVLEEVAPGPAKRLRGVVKGAERAANLIRQLLAYSGKAEVVARELDVTQAISEMRELMQISVPKSVRLHLHLEQRLPVLAMDPAQFEQVIMNLVINAGEAIGEGHSGEIRVSTSADVVDEPFIDALGSEVQPGRFVRIEFTDSGSGISPEALARLFDPFFSTKLSGRGLGLAAVAGIVRSSRGAVMVESAPGEGTTFRVLLPVASADSESTESPADPHKRVILVVDDDDCVREYIAAVGRRRGYRVLTASDGAEALSICDRKRIDAVVLDVVMPVMGASVLLPEIRRRQPLARILLTSGYSESEARRLCAAFLDAAFLQKPYTFEQVGAAIAELLGAEMRAGDSDDPRPRRRSTKKKTIARAKR